MKKILLFDAINALKLELIGLNSGVGKLKVPADKLIDSVLDILIMAYVYGADDAEEMLGAVHSEISIETLNAAIYFRYEDGKTFVDRIREYATGKSSEEGSSENRRSSTSDDIPRYPEKEESKTSKSGHHKGSGEKSSTSDNITPNGSSENAEKVGTISDIIRIAETEAHRLYNQGEIDAAESSGMDYTKTWSTMMDDKVRDTHWYLEGTTVGRNERFYTFDGDSALSPGGFASARNNANCRCYLDITPV